MKFFSNKEIPIKELKLWDENARFSDKYFQKTENELIDYFCLNKKFKIVELATDIVADFDIPQVEKLIVYETPLGNTTIEGNRRLAVFKLLCNPELTSDSDIKKKFVELSSKISISEDFRLECVVTEDIDKGYHLIERKHTKSNNEISWGDNERAHHNSRRGKANQSEKLKVAITNVIRELDIPEELKDQVLGPGYVTNFWRILDNSIASKVLGFSMNDNGELKISDADFKSKLKVIIFNVLQKKDFSENKIDSRSLNTNKDKEDYLKSITPEHYKEVESEIKKNTVKDIFGGEAVNVGNPKKTPRTKQDNLIIFGRKLSLKDGETNNIYRDISDLYIYYQNNKHTLSKSFCSLIRMSLRLIIESAKNTDERIDDYVNSNFEDAKKTLTQDEKTTLSNCSITQSGLIKLLQNGAHNYSASSNIEQTIAMSIIIGAMLNITHSKK